MKRSLQHSSIKFIRNNTQKIKYIGLLIFFLSVIITTKTYINYLTIQETIQKTQIEINTKNNEIAFTENFYLPYQNSEYRDFFFSHKNNILFWKEKIIKLEFINNQNNNDNENKTKNKESEINNKKNKISPQEARNNFIKEKRKKIE